MNGAALDWQLLCADPESLPWQENNLTIISHAEKQYSLARFDGRYYAFAATCPHAGGKFTEGWIDALGQIVCPLHRYRFSLDKGRNTSGEGYHLKTYPLELRPAGLYIGLPKSRLFGF